MKTAEEWNRQYKEDTSILIPPETFTDSHLINFIKKIQADALRHASTHIYHRVGDMMSLMQRPNCSTIAHELEVMAIDLKREKVE